MKCDCGCEGYMELVAASRDWVPDWLSNAIGDNLIMMQPFRWILTREPTQAERKFAHGLTVD